MLRNKIKKNIKDLKDIGSEIGRLKERIEELETIVTSTVKPLSDMPKGGGKPNYNMENLVILKGELEKMLGKLERLKIDLERFILKVPDAHTRLILECRYIDGMTWNQVADFIGGNTEDSVRMIANRYLK